MCKKYRDREFWICGCLMCIFSLAYSSLYMFNVHPFTEGWGVYFVELLERGQVPYRDFYYYLPPLNLAIEWILWKLSFGSMFVFRVWYLLQRILMMCLLYNLMTKWFAPRYAWLACLTGVCLRAAVVWDMGGDYNQTQTLFVILLMYAVVWFLEKDADIEKKTWREYKYIFLAGMLISLMVLLKQSMGLSALLLSFLFLVGYCVVFKDKAFGWYCLATAAGAVIPLGICTGILAANGALVPFCEQFFGVAGAKGGLFVILFGGIKMVLANKQQILLFVSCLLTLWSFMRLAKKKIPLWVFIGQVLILMLLFNTFSVAIGQSVSLIKESTTLSVLLVGLFCLYGIFIWKHQAPLLRHFSKTNSLWLTVFLFLGMFVILRTNVNGLTAVLYNRTSLFSEIPNYFVYFTFYTAILCLVAGFGYYACKQKLLYPKAVMFLFVGGLIDAYANMMNASNMIFATTLFVIAPVCIVVLFEIKLPRWEYTKNLAICILCILICGISMTQKYTTAYTWWGAEYSSELSERTEPVDVDGLEGFRLSAQKKLEYEQIVKIINENGTEDSTVWGFPHVKVFNILTNHYNVEDPVPVLFYDVCPDDAAIIEYEWLKENYPDFVIWCDLPGCIETHEYYFRNSEALGQREIVNWFAQIKDTAYIKVGQVGNLFVYQINDGSPINYTYFQDPNAKNITAGEY